MTMSGYGQKSKLAAISLLVIVLMYVTFYVHSRYNTSVVFTHLFYIPILLASFWWRFRGIIVSVILSSFLIFSHYYFSREVNPVDDYLRGAILIFVSTFTAFMSYTINRMKQRENTAGKELDRIFNKSTNGMMVVDGDYKITQINMALLNMLGSDKDASAVFSERLHCYDLVSNPNCRTSNCPCRNIFDGAPLFERDMALQTVAGRQVYCIVTALPFRTEDNKVKSVILDFKNITERKENETKFARYRKQLCTMASELSLAEERERRRLATNLHDSVSQSLFVCKMKLAEMQKNSGAEENREALNAVCSDIDKAIKETRTLIFEISPPVLYELGLASAIEWLCNQLSKKHNIKCVFRNEMTEKTPNIDISVLIFQTVRELLNNVVKHADASNIKILLKGGNEYLRCVVEDDGKGFDVSSLNRYTGGNGGFGLFNIRERLSYFEGSLQIESSLNKGVKATIIAPYESFFRNTAGGVSG